MSKENILNIRRWEIIKTYEVKTACSYSVKSEKHYRLMANFHYGYLFLGIYTNVHQHSLYKLKNLIRLYMGPSWNKPSLVYCILTNKKYICKKNVIYIT